MKVEGWASTDSLDWANHVVSAGAFKQSISERGFSGPYGIRLLAQHDRNKIIGAISALTQKSKGLWIEAEIDEEIEDGLDMARKIRAAGGLNFSVGFYLKAYSIVNPEKDDWYIKVEKGDLFEVSVVTFPANDDAQMVSFKANPLAEGVAMMRQAKLDIMQLHRTLDRGPLATPVAPALRELDSMSVTLARMNQNLQTLKEAFRS